MCKQWICRENQLSGFYFKITLTGNELSITNNEIHGFSNGFQHIKNWENTFFPTTWERGFEEMFLAESPRQLGASSNSQKITRWWIIFFFFFKIHIADLF